MPSEAILERPIRLLCVQSDPSRAATVTRLAGEPSVHRVGMAAAAESIHAYLRHEPEDVVLLEAPGPGGDAHLHGRRSGMGWSPRGRARRWHSSIPAAPVAAPWLRHESWAPPESSPAPGPGADLLASLQALLR